MRSNDIQFQFFFPYNKVACFIWYWSIMRHIKQNRVWFAYSYTDQLQNILHFSLKKGSFHISTSVLLCISFISRNGNDTLYSWCPVGLCDKTSCGALLHCQCNLYFWNVNDHMIDIYFNNLFMDPSGRLSKLIRNDTK